MGTKLSNFLRQADRLILTLTVLSWRIWWAPNNASKWQVGFNSAFEGLTAVFAIVFSTGLKICEEILCPFACIICKNKRTTQVLLFICRLFFPSPPPPRCLAQVIRNAGCNMDHTVYGTNLLALLLHLAIFLIRSLVMKLHGLFWSYESVHIM